MNNKVYMYKYIQGKEVLLKEHMLSATELAKVYGLYTLNNNPNGFLVSRILADYISDKNLNIAEYYYPHSRGVMRVYPAIVYDAALSNFVFDLQDGNEYTYIIKEEGKKSRINYKYKARQNQIISMTERRKQNVKE